MRSRESKMFRAIGVFWMVGLVLSGCGERGKSELREVDRLRLAFERDPGDLRTARLLAEAELFTYEGEPPRARAPIARLKSADPSDPVPALLEAELSVLLGEMRDAGEAYLTAISLASKRDDALSQAILESAIGDLGALASYLPARPRIFDAFQALFEDETLRLGLPVHSRLGSQLIAEAYRKGDAALAMARAATIGCIAEYRVAGPFGPHNLLGFDDSLPPERDGVLRQEYELGKLRGVRPTRSVDARGCEALLGGGEYEAGGVYYAEARVQIPRSGRYIVNLETPNSAVLYVNGKERARIDRRQEPSAIDRYLELDLEEGEAIVRVKIASRHANPILAMAVREKTEKDLALPEPNSHLERYLRAARLLGRGDVIGARELYRVNASELGGLALSLYIAISENDPLRFDENRRDAARDLSRRLRRQSPEAWLPILNEALLAAAEGRTLEAIETLREAHAKYDEVYSLTATLRSYLLERGFDAEADRLLDRLELISPAGCNPIEERLETALRRDRHHEVLPLAEAMRECDHENHALLNYYLRRGEYAEAMRELERLEALLPRSRAIGLLGTKIYIARAQGDDAEVDALLEALMTRDPRSSGTLREIFDRDLSRGEREAGVQKLRGAFEKERNAFVDLRFLLADLRIEDPFEGYWIDGLEVIEEFKASEARYDQGLVLIFDYLVTRVLDDGTQLTLVHQIQLANSEEAVDALGEFQAPNGADLLVLRTIKADGRILEPDSIAGKDSISLPSLARGDFVESVYQLGVSPAETMQGGIAGDRFIFESYEVPFHRSEAVYIFPKKLEPSFDVRGNLPPPAVEERGEERVYRFRVDGRLPPEAEPNSAHPFEFLTSVRWTVDYGWERLVEAFADGLSDRVIVDPAHLELAKQIAGDGSSEERARRIYRWVLKNIEDGDHFMGQAAAIVAARSGSQTRALHYLLKLADIPSTILFARSFSADQTKMEAADNGIYDRALLRIDLGDRTVDVSTGGRHLPFGYLGSDVRGQDAIAITRGGSIVNVDERGEDHRLVTVRATLDADGSALIEIEERLSGAFGISWRNDLDAIPEADFERIFEQAYAARLLPGASLEALGIEDADDPERPLVLRYRLDAPRFGHREGSEFVLPSLFPMGLSPSLTNLPSRTTPTLIDRISFEIEMEVKAPKAQTVRAHEAIREQGPGGAFFEMDFEGDAKRFVQRRRVDIPRMRVDADDYPELYRFTRAVDAADQRAIRLRF